MPRPAHQLSAQTCSATSAPGGDIRSTNSSAPRLTGTTTAFDPCETAPTIVSSHRAHCWSTASGRPWSQSAPSVHHRGIRRNDSGKVIIAST
ncbi:hypothetical protein JOF29_005343 [Kribbella aluminosa]|uniref:Uncharacterized protein n=1 Tax=Kribbella aluminosa TaxID=416017 RepID=A0ABS4URH3_9ACTN|nr:hypothetical protein [Kribbella aluminosa]